MNRNNENLEQLLRQFVDPSQAHQMAEDIEQADRLFTAHPVPSVSGRTLSRIQKNVQKQSRHIRHAGVAWIAAAGLAAVLLLGLYTLLNQTALQPESSSQPIAQNIRPQRNVFYVQEGSPADIEHEISRLLEAIQDASESSYESVNTIQKNLTQIEKELASDSQDFWKG